MPSSSSPLFKRLRRHRGLWALVVAVLLIKLASGSICVADGGKRDGFSGPASAAIAMTVQAPAALSDGDCLLGEGGACHCACAHAVGLPSSVVLAVGRSPSPLLVPSVDGGRLPALSASLLRPPIA